MEISQENLGLMPGTSHAISQREQQRISVLEAKEKLGDKVMIVDGRGTREPRLVLINQEDVLKALANGYQLARHFASQATWIEPIDPEKKQAGTLNYEVRWRVFNNLQKLKHIEKLGQNKTIAYWRITKEGMTSYAKASAPKSEKQPTKDSPVRAQAPASPAPEPITETKESRTFHIQTSNIITGKKFVMTVFGNVSELPLVQFALGLTGKPLLAEVVIPDTTKGSCFYCTCEVTLNPKGKKPWRVCCYKPGCRSRYEGEKKVRREMIKEGLITE